MAGDIKWGWYDTQTKKAQSQVFDTAEKALADMERRQGKNLDLARLAEVGYRLAIVNVTVEVVTIMSPP